MHVLEMPNGSTAEPARETRRTRRRYDRMEAEAEANRFRAWRAIPCRRVRGPRVLEVGVGTGKNFPYYPPNLSMTGIDLSPRMLERAKMRAQDDRVGVDLRVADSQALPFPDASFDTVVATFVFCSVPDAVQGRREARRVLVPGAQLLLLEHVLSRRPILRLFMRLANPFVVRLVGANIDRDTVGNVERAGFAMRQVDGLWGTVVKLIEAGRPQETTA